MWPFDYMVTGPFDYMVTWQIQKTYICSSAIPMAIKLDRVVTCSGQMPPSKSRDLFITWSRGKFKKLISALPQYLWPPNFFKITWTFDDVVTWQLEKTYIYTYKIPMATKLTLGKSHPLFYVIFWYHGHVKNGKPYNCLSTIPRASKFGRELT